MKDPAAVNAMWKGKLVEHIGMRFVETGPDRVVAELEVREHLRTLQGTVHGGTLMALADAAGGTATLINLPEGVGTATIESKTNFFAAVRAGTCLRGECVPLHRGRRTMVWQTTLRNAEGKVAAVVTQTQMVLLREQGPEEQLAALFRDRPPEEMRATLARLERAGAAIYEMLATSEADPEARQALVDSGRRELENAETLDRLAAGADDTSATSKR